MNEFHQKQAGERTERRNVAARNPLARYLPLVATVAIALSPLSGTAEGRHPARPAQCSASVQTGQIPSGVSRGARSTVINTPLLRENSYLSLTLPESYLGQVRSTAMARPQEERQGVVADLLQNNVQIALSAVGTGTRATFACAPLDGTIPSPAPSATPSQSARPSPSARPAPSATVQPTAQPSAPPASATPQPSAAPQRQDRGRTITP